MAFKMPKRDVYTAKLGVKMPKKWIPVSKQAFNK